MDDRYEVFDTLGKGVFSTVLRARDTAHKNALGKHPEVAVKVSQPQCKNATNMIVWSQQAVAPSWEGVQTLQRRLCTCCRDGTTCAK